MEPVQYGGHRATEMQGNPFSFNQALGALDVISGSRMVKRFDLQVMILIPLAGTDVEIGYSHPFVPRGRGGTLLMSLPQQIGEEMVIAVPPPLIVQRDDEKVSTVEILEGFLPGSSGVEHNGITQGAAQAVEDRRAQQECLNAFGLLLQDFFDQVIHDEVVAAGERADEAGGVGMALQAQRGQL